MADPATRARNGWLYLLATSAVVAAGLASRKFPSLLPSMLDKYPGDALWGMMVFLGWAVLLPTWRTLSLARLALSTCYTVELSQLYHAPWIDGIRATTLGHLALGSTFNWLDLVAYTAGTGLAAVIDRYLSQWYDRKDEWLTSRRSIR
jgi:hypothetical protein